MALTQINGGMLDSVAQQVGFRNRIINGAMVIDQRNAGASVTPTSFSYTLDRWSANLNQSGKYSVQQNAGAVTPPTGFTNYLGVTSLAATSVGASDFFFVEQRIEGFNTADFSFGSASAATITLSFWVRSSLTGTFGGAIRNSGNTRSYPFSYTITAANTWEQKSITIAGDTTGTWLTNNGLGVAVAFGLGIGSTFSNTAGAWATGNFVSATGATSVVGTNGATFYITGVQLEKGSTATSFDYRPYGTEFQLCQRYYQQISQSDGVSYQAFGLGMGQSSTNISVVNILPVPMRSAPSFAFNNIGNTFIGNGSIPSSVSMDIASTSTIMLNVGASGISTFGCYRWYRRDANAASLTLSAEL